jgi:organic hydroperoxide reductase OsmC/OhrA
VNSHHFAVTMRWTGNQGSGTSGYRAYGRDHEIVAADKVHAIEGSSHRTFRGDASRYNPEELLIAALSSCHMLAYLHLCADAGVIVTGYEDEASGTLKLNSDGSGQFTDVLLAPVVTLADPSQTDIANELHHKAHDLCFIARSVNFPVRCEPQVRVATVSS